MQRNRMRVKRAYVLAAGVSILCAGLLAQAAEASTAKSPPGTITTIAGGPGGPGPALGVGLSVCSVRFVRGALYISGDAMVRRVNPRTGWLTTPSANWLAVNWVTFDVADGNLEPCGVTVDSSGNVLEATGSQVVVVAGKSGRFYGHRMRAGHTYVIVDEHRRPRLPGGRSGNGGPALGARLADSVDVQLDSAGNVILTDAGQGAGRDTPALGALVRVVAEHTGRFYGQKMRTGNIYTIAGAAALPAKPSSIATRTWLGSSIRTARVDRYGNLVVVNGFGLANTHGDTTPAVRVVAVRTGSFYGRRMVAGHMYLVAGNGTGRDSGDGGPASRAGLACADGAALDHNGNIVIADCRRIRVVAERSGRFYGREMTEGDIYTIAGAGVGGDGRPAGQASVDAIGVTVDDAGNVIVAEPLDVRVIAARAGRGYGQFFRAGDIYRIAGTSQFGITGDGGPALKAEFVPRDIAADAAGDLAIADPNAAVVRFVPAASGTFFGQRMRKGDIYSVARNVYTPNFGFPQSGIAFDAAGNVLAAQSGLPGVQVAAVRDGVFYGLAMTAGHVYRIPSNDDVGAVAVDSSGNVLMADTSDNTVSVLAVTSGTFYDRQMTAGNLYTIAGNGQQADTGDGGPATAAALAQPAAIAADHHGNMLIADLSGVRVVAATTGVFFGKHMTAGDIYTLTTGSSIDGLAVDKSGNVLAATFSRVKLIAARTGTFYGIRAVTGRVYAVAGNGQTGFSGDGGPAVRASLDETLSVAVGPAGNLLIADWLNMRIRSVTP